MNTTKLLISTFALGALSVSSINVMATEMYEESQYYAGLQLGVGFVDINDENVTKSTLSNITGNSVSYSNSTSGFAGRVYLGYNLIPDVSVELGYAKYNNATSDAHSDFQGGNLATSAKNKTSAIDLLAVYTVPVMDDVSVSLKAGFAYVMNKYEVSANLNGQDIGVSSSHTSRRIKPKFAISADYDVMPDVSVGLSYEITQGSGRPISTSFDGNDLAIHGNNHYTPMLQMLSLDVKYRF